MAPEKFHEVASLLDINSYLIAIMQKDTILLITLHDCVVANKLFNIALHDLI